MRVLHITSNLSRRSGIMAVIMNYNRHINHEKIQFDFLYYDEREVTYEEEIRNLGGRIYKITRPTSYTEYRKEMKLFWKTHYGEYEILHLHDSFLVGFFANAKKQGGVKMIISHAHATKFADSRSKELRNKIFSLANNFVTDRYFACSKDAGEYIFGKKFLNDGVVLNNAIELDKFRFNEDCRKQLRSEFDLENRFVVGHVGNFIRPKNHPFIVRIFCDLLRKNPNAVLVLIGDGPNRIEIEKLCRRQGVYDNVRFLGTRTNVNELLSALDCFLFPSLYEGLGIALIEAQANGLPCVYSSVVPKDANVIKKATHVLCLEDSSSKWAEVILETENKRIDTDTAKKALQDAGFDIDLEAEKLERIYLRYALHK